MPDPVGGSTNSGDRLVTEEQCVLFASFTLRTFLMTMRCLESAFVGRSVGPLVRALVSFLKGSSS